MSLLWETSRLKNSNYGSHGGPYIIIILFFVPYSIFQYYFALDKYYVVVVLANDCFLMEYIPPSRENKAFHPFCHRNDRSWSMRFEGLKISMSSLGNNVRISDIQYFSQSNHARAMPIIDTPPKRDRDNEHRYNLI